MRNSWLFKFAALSFFASAAFAQTANLIYNRGVRQALPTNIVFFNQILSNNWYRGGNFTNISLDGTTTVNDTLIYNLTDESQLTFGVDYGLALDVGLSSTTGRARVRSVPDLSTLTNSVNPLNSDLFSTFQVLGDQGGQFRLVLANTVTESTYGPHYPANNATYAWSRVLPGYLTPKMFCAAGNFVATSTPTGTDDTAALQAMIDYAASSDLPVIATPGNYQITSTLTIPDGFSSSLNFGSAVLDAGANFYVNATNVPFLTLLDPSRFEIGNLSVYFKPTNGWGLSDAVAQPQQNTNAYTFRVIGWGTFLNIHDISSFYGSGLIQNYLDNVLVPGRSEARLFNNNIETVTCRYGKVALDLNAGSGSTWNNLYLNSSSGGTTNQLAQSALVVREFVNNELFHRVNLEWSGFTHELMALTNAEIQFDGMHVEGVNFPYQSSGIRWGIAISGGAVTFNKARIQDVRPDWGSITKFGLFSIVGSPVTSLAINSSIFERFTESPDPTLYTMHRYLDYAGGLSYIQVDQLNERDVGWWTNSPSWYGFDERPLLASKRAENRSDFLNGLNGWSVFYALSPTAYSYITSPTNAPGVIRLNSGTANFTATVLQLPYAGTYTGGAVQRMRVRWKLAPLPAAGTDDIRLRIGFMSDVTGSPATAPTDGVYLNSSYTDYTDNRVSLRATASSSSTDSVLIAGANIAANTWYETEISINNDGTQTRAYLNPRTSANAANVVATIPTATTALFPAIQLVKRGSAAATNVQLEIDSIDVLIAPNGIY